MHTYFDILCDKYGSPYFTTAEKDILLNRAQIRFVEENLPNVDTAQDTNNKLSTLIFAPNTITLSSSTLSKTALRTAIRGLSGDGNLEIWRVLAIYSVNNGVTTPVKFLRHNDLGPVQANSFKSQSKYWFEVTLNEPVYSFLNISAADALQFWVLKYPKVLAHPSTSSDLPDFTHNEIVALAVDLAGIAIRDEALAQLNQLNK